ncbi:hypothetical protein SLS57_012175 [Botryosphaeria dothidea]
MSNIFATPPHPVTKGILSPFQISVPDEEVQHFKTLLNLCPIAAPNYANNASHRGTFGVTRDWLVNAKTYWESQFSWREHETILNSIPQFKIQVKDDHTPDGDGSRYSIHFAALFSQKTDAVPIIMMHGWPGSFIEFLPILLKVLDQYADKPSELPFHIIVPSLSGFGFSSPPSETKDFSPIDQARVLVKMMTALGFDRFVAQGGDLGSFVATAMAVQHPEVAALHLNLVAMLTQPTGLKDPSYTQAELDALQRAKSFLATEADFATLQGHKPSTAGLAVGSSPIALLAWIGEKMVAWSDPATRPSLDHILLNISLYWFTRSYPTSLWYYRNFVDPSRGDRVTIEDVRDKLLGFSLFAKELAYPPKAWRDACGNFTWFREHGKGGHFAAFEQPDELWQDVVDFVNEQWKQQDG